jgi:4-hydroxy 2-oxovalerate aldolase/long-chain acyl-CoA synthetase
MEKITILETTLRDGSYAINFSFTSADTELICRELESAGFEYIEIGHGMGLNASNKGLGKSSGTDEEYMVAADTCLKNAHYGMFCIPGIATLDDIDLAARHNMEFIRIGTNVTDVRTSQPFIKRAKEYGMIVFSNFMKSYALPPEKFASKVTLSEKYGSDIVYLVDSSGGMFKKDIQDYFHAIRKLSDITLGFHGHDNLGLGISNSLEAIELGFGFVDSSLQGLGRSSGNPSTEILVACLIKQGYDLNIDFIKILDTGQKYVQPLIGGGGKTALDTVAGFADFHSSYMGYINKYATKYHVNPVLLIIGITKIDKVNLNEKKLKDLAISLKNTEEIYLGKYNFSKYIGNEQKWQEIRGKK